jgi:2-dehydropantoate 2-reductase
MLAMHAARLVIVGAGAIGGSLAALAALAGHDVVVVARGAHASHIRSRGLLLRRPQRDDVVKLACVTHPRDVDWRGGDLLVLATKLNDAEAALADVARCAGSGVPVLCATNGIHGEPLAARHFTHVVAGMVFVPGVHLEPGVVAIHAEAPGVFDVGPHTPPATAAAEACARMLVACGYDCELRPDIARWKHAKLLTNLGAVARLFDEHGWHALARDARAEGAAILDATGRERVPAAEFEARVARVSSDPIAGVPRPGNSVWQSHRRGRPLETPYLEGAIVALAREHGLAAPVNAALLSRAGFGLPEEE